MAEIVVLSLTDDRTRSGCGDECGCGGHGGEKPAAATRVPVLTCADALRQAGASVTVACAADDAEIDAALKPVEAGDARLVLAVATDGELRAVIRRLVRHLSPPPSQRPAELPPNRTVFDLPPVAVLPLTPAIPGLVERLNLPRDPTTVAAAVLAGATRRFDLLRNDGGSITLSSGLVGGVNAEGSIGLWHGRVEVDDIVLADGSEPLVVCAISNAGPSSLDGLPLIIDPDANDGLVEVAVAVPVVKRRLVRAASVRFEVRRARGRAVSVTPRDPDAELPFVDDGVAGVLTRKRSWWTEPEAWAAYVT